MITAWRWPEDLSDNRFRELAEQDTLIVGLQTSDGGGYHPQRKRTGAYWIVTGQRNGYTFASFLVKGAKLVKKDRAMAFALVRCRYKVGT